MAFLKSQSLIFKISILLALRNNEYNLKVKLTLDEPLIIGNGIF